MSLIIDLKTSNEIIGILAFLMTTWVGVYIFFGKKMRQDALKNRLHCDDLGKGNSLGSKITQSEKTSDFVQKIEKELKESKTNISVNTFIIISIFCAIISSSVGCIFFKGFFFAIVLFGIGLIIPRFWLKNKRRKFIESFNKEMIKPLNRMAATLRVGGSLDQALQEVINSKMINSFVKEEFAKVYASFKAGFSINEAFYEIYKSVPSKDTLYLCAAIDIQMGTGGDKAQIMEDVANQISKKNLDQKGIKAKLGEINASIKIMMCMPIVFGIIVNMGNPGHFRFFTDSFAGQLIGFLIAAFMIGGYFAMKKMSRIDLD